MRGPDDAQFTELVRACWPGLYRTAYLLLGDEGLAEDLVQTALAKTYASWDKVRDPSRARAYARTVMVNTATSWFRRRSWRGEVATESLPDSGREDDRHDWFVLAQALAALPVRQRAVVVLRFYDDLSVEQTAELLGITTGTVKSQTSHGLAKLRLALGEDTDVPEGARRG